MLLNPLRHEPLFCCKDFPTPQWVAYFWTDATACFGSSSGLSGCGINSGSGCGSGCRSGYDSGGSSCSYSAKDPASKVLSRYHGLYTP